MDLIVMWLADSWEISLLRTSLLAAQIGLVTVWAVLGSTRWFIRIPLALIIAIVVAAPAIGSQMHFHDTESLFIVQTAAICLICGVLRSQGYALRLQKEPSGPAANGTAEAARLLQFGIRDVLLWTTALAVILGVAQQGRSVTLTAGVLASIVLVTALWAALGEGRFWLRWAVLILVSLVSGIVYTICQYFAAVSNASWNEILQDWFWLFSQWFVTLIWPPLAGGLLFAALLIFRTRGYRLSRALPPREAVS
jgi:hypothetical protein